MYQFFKKYVYLPRLIALGNYLLWVVFLCSIISSSYAATGTDYLAPARGDIASTFGDQSVVEYGLYLAEIIGGVVGYMKSRNFLWLIGIAVVILFTKVGFTKLIPTA